ncbi:hypothetical protein M427DRAFT_153094 [Gonapodya prolifera JEL478]|uniref:Uncharacterized protein n=1 Tax=Gonapodya prolifera (strain JEL478) TaxID=1344416 RepID=A0A139AQ05_GONPJ|nr:hypothetical protein M427DRAFT_153094 [Gonapodya prolifera JEL478]|eukprot:KXS18734.1 hypothetical protein M427DRAFT_153094 [Gonapodya prolifera JEL478]
MTGAEEVAESADAVIRNEDHESSFRVPRHKILFLVGCMLATIAGLSIFLPAILEVEYMCGLIQATENVAKQRYYISRILMLATEVAVDDTTVWNRGEAEMYLIHSIDVATTAAEIVRVGQNGVPGTDDLPFLYNQLVVGGICNNAAGCNSNRTYNASIGLTPALVYSGVEEVQRTFLVHARAFATAPPSQRTLQNSDYMLIYAIFRDLAAGLTNAYNPMFNLGVAAHDRSTAELTCVFSLAIMLLLCNFLFIFRRLVRDLSGQTDELVGIVFAVPKAVVQPGSPLAKCIETGGLSVEMAMEDASV